jgi:uncharacterized protein (TIGR02996 family)
VTDEAALVAAVVADPDDAGGFLVYADFLQSRGDPRGELITLMHAGEDKLADKLLRAHKAKWIGRLESPSIKLDWRLGFVDQVKLIADNEKHALLLVDELANHPSCRFVRKLEILILAKRRSYAGVDARLVELGRPLTLTEVTFGKPGEHTPSPAFLETFRRVAATPQKSWPDVVAAIASVRRQAPSFAQDELVPVTTASGSPLPIDAQQLVRGLAGEVAGKQPVGLVARLQEECTADMLDRYAASLATAWRLHGEEPRTAWALDVASILGGARAASRIALGFAATSHARATHVVDCLARMRTPLALLELFAATGHWATRGEQADTALAAIANRANLDVASLLARAGSDPRDAFDDDTLARFRELDRLLVEHLMAIGWTAPLATVADGFARAPRRAWCGALVWRAHPGGLFAFDDGARPVDRDRQPVELAPSVAVGLAHVAEPGLDPHELAAWRTWQHEQRHLPPFEQLRRTAPGARTTDELAALVDSQIDIELLRARGYRNGGFNFELRQQDQFLRRYLYRGKPYAVVIEPFSWRNRPLEHVPSDPLPPVVAFEVARDLGRARDSGRL